MQSEKSIDFFKFVVAELICTEKNNMILFFLTQCYFFDPISVNRFFLEDVVKINIIGIFVLFEIRRCKLLTLCQKIHLPSVNRFDGDDDDDDALVLTTRTKVRLIHKIIT